MVLCWVSTPHEWSAPPYRWFSWVHLPMMQQHAESWRSGHRRQPAVGTGEQASHEQVWSVTLALATIKGMVDRPNDRCLSRYLKNLTRPHPHVMQQHPQVGGSGRLRTRSRSGLWVVGCDGLYSSMGINAAWHSLLSMVIIVMHRTHYRLWLTLWTAEEANAQGLGIQRLLARA